MLKNDQKWLDALAGKNHDDSSDEVKEALLLRSIIQKKINSQPPYDTSDFGLYRLIEDAKRQKLLTPDTQKKNRESLNMFGSLIHAANNLITSQSYAFATTILVVGLTAVVGWQTMEIQNTSNEMLVLRGGKHETVEVKLDEKFKADHMKMIEVEDSNSKTHEILDSALNAGLTVYISKKDNVTKLVVIGLESMSLNQVGFKALAGVPNQLGGSVELNIESSRGK